MARIILAFSSDTAASKIRAMLEGTGHNVSHSVCHSGAELSRTVHSYDEVLIIMGFKLPDMTVNHIYENLHTGCKIISIVKAEHVEDIEYEEILAMPLPISRQRLVSSINMLFGSISEHKKDITRTPEEERLINQAKLFLMERYHMTEQQAHRFIQKRSMDVGAKSVDTARSILNIDEQ